MSKNSSTFHPNQIVPPRVRRGGDSAVTLWQALSSTIMAWVLPGGPGVGIQFQLHSSRYSLSHLLFFLHLSPGRFVRSLGEWGTEPGQFKDPVAITATDECVLVVDHWNKRCNARVLFFETDEYCL
jgi:hypothetical protein